MPDTIVALATPNGRSGIGVIRLSGGRSLEIVRKLTADQAFCPVPRTAHLKSIFQPETAEPVDQALITFFKAPSSFTGEDVVEISCHGSPVVLRQVIDICLAQDARMADPGEFSLRALANGRMNLTEAEAIRDLIDAQTLGAARQAVRQMRGEFSAQLQPLKDELLNVIVILESAIEFVEDDLPALQSEAVKRALLHIATEIAKIAATFSVGHLIRDGLRVALVGRPNVGKSSLFNALLGTERAIVTDIAGTTRDQIHERFTINDIPISLIDTAGLRETMDTVEMIGVERSRAAIVDADLVIVLLDASEPLSEEDTKVLSYASDLQHIVVANKIDKVSQSGPLINPGELKNGPGKTDLVPVSAKTGEGLDSLRTAIVDLFLPNDSAVSGFLVSDARHHDLLARSKSEIDQSIADFERKLSEEIVLIGLHNALRYLGEITGETTTEDMLTRVFSTFCIGK